MLKLIGDIGGTNARLALVDEQRQIFDIKIYKKKEFDNIAEAINAYLQNRTERPIQAVLAVNAPIGNGKPIKNKNDWGYHQENLLEQTRLQEIAFVNDGVAHAMAIPYLDNKDKSVVYDGITMPHGLITAIGVGTEVGFAFGVFDAKLKKYIFQPSEGGAQMAAAVTPRQAEILAKISIQGHLCEWNQIASGRGIAHIYEALFDEPKTTAEIMQDLQQGEPKAVETFALFTEFLGLLVRNAAFTFLPYGGIYLTGGVLAHQETLAQLLSSEFEEYYQWGADQLCCIQKIPVFTANNNISALIGLAKGYF